MSALVLAALLLAPSQSRVPRDVDPATYASPSGTFVLEVDPSRRDGGGPGAYRMLREGHDVWSGGLPVTLLDARVSESGEVFGYALSEGRYRAGFLHAVVLAPDGTMLADEARERHASRFEHRDPAPSPLGLLIIEDAGLGVLRLEDPDANRGLESWWVHRLSTGERIAELQPGPLLGGENERWRVYGAETLDGTGLVLAWGFVARGRSGLGDLDAQWFALLEPEGRVAWKLADPGAFASEVGDLTGYDLLARLRERGAILSSGPGGAFRVRRVAEGAVVAYRAERDAETAGGWRVVEVGREPDEDLARETAAPPAPEIPRVALRHVGSVPLQTTAASLAPELGPVAAWSFDGTGGFLVVREVERRAFEHLRVDGEGQVLETRRLGDLPAEPEGRIAWLHLGGDRWLATLSPFGIETTALAFLADAATGALRPIEGFASPAIEALAATPDGGFVALATHHYQYTFSYALLTFDGEGRERWRIDEGQGDPADAAALFAPEDVAVLPAGEVAVLDKVRPAIQVFGSNGAFVRLLDLEGAWEDGPGYLVGLEAAPRDGMLVLDSDAARRLRVIGPDGAVRRTLLPRRADGYADPALAYHARFAPDGALWTCDGYRIYRLDDTGLEERAVGAPPSPEWIHEPVGATGAIDALGRICVLDRWNGALHVFDAEGRKLFVALPEPSDLSGASARTRIVSRSDGALAVQYAGRNYLLFDASGSRIGMQEAPRAFLDFGPGDQSFVACDGGIEVRSGAEVVACVRRFPSRRWLSLDDVHAFPDGSFAVVGDGEVGLFGAGGEPRASYRLPMTEGEPRRPPGPYVKTITASERWIVLSGWQREIWLIDREGGAARLVSLDEVPEGSSCFVALAPDGSEVWALELPALVLHRYALP